MHDTWLRYPIKLSGETVRKTKIRDDGTTRSSFYYNIIDEEWEDVRQGLVSQLNKK